MTDSRYVDCQSGWQSDDLREVGSDLKNGAIAVLPTDTVYGIGALAQLPQSVDAVLQAKGRGRQMPPPVLVSSVHDIDALCVEVPEAAYRLAETFWPGALTLILLARPDLGWDLGETGGTLALRMPDDAIALELLRTVGPMAVTSANTTGHAPALTCDEAVAYFADRVDCYIDGGTSRGGVASTIIDLAHGEPALIREGAISWTRIAEILHT